MRKSKDMCTGSVRGLMREGYGDMKIRRIVAFLLIPILLLSLMPVYTIRASAWSSGNSDLNILSGGIMIRDGTDFYYSDAEGIYLERREFVRRISEDEGRNLNNYGDRLLYTLGNSVYALPKEGGEAKKIYEHPEDISQMYLISNELLYILSEGVFWEYNINEGSLQRLSALTDIVGIVPTVHGNILIKGQLFDYTAYVDDKPVLDGIGSIYTDSGYLAIQRDNIDYQIKLEKFFSGFDKPKDLERFHIHGSVKTQKLLHEDEAAECPVCEENALKAESHEHQEPLPESETIARTLSAGQENIVKRARQQSEIKWTPLADRLQWGERGTFTAGTTYQGLPYGQPVLTGYVPWTVSFTDYINAVNNNGSKFYQEYSTYNKTAPFYSSDCSSYVSYAWGTHNRMTTYNLPTVATKINDQSIYSLNVGDIINHNTSHVVLVSYVGYNSQGNIVTIDIMEQTPVIARKTRYGEGGTKALSALQSTYFNSGYVSYRNPSRDNVAYKHECAVPIDGDYCANCKASAPVAKITNTNTGKNISLHHEEPNAAIYYTLNGDTPTSASTRYSGVISITGSTKLRAIAVVPGIAGSFILEYGVAMTSADAPRAEVTKGEAYGDMIERGSQITLMSGTAGAAIYYTTDGTVPTANSARYTVPITVNSDMTIKAIASASGMADSSVSTFTYKVGTCVYIASSAGRGGSISPSGRVPLFQGAERVFTITESNGYKISDVQVNGRSLGAIKTYVFKELTMDASINVVFEEIFELPFADVSESQWYSSAVNYAYRNELFAGTSGTTFSPDVSMTRGMFVTATGRLAKIPKELRAGVGIVTGDSVNMRQGPGIDTSVISTCRQNQAVQVMGVSGDWHRIMVKGVTGYIRSDYLEVYKGVFKDVPSNAYYAPYVEWAYLAKIASGTSWTTFSPNNNITREQMCLILYNYVEEFGLDLATNANTQNFTDNGSVSVWARDAVTTLQKAGVITGVGYNRFDPKGTATRAQVAQIFQNLFKAAK